jgi:hypothetical protein
MLRFLSLACFALLLCAGCGEDDVSPSPDNPQATGALVSIEGCKTFLRASGDEKNKSCLNWTYSPTSRTLDLIHENAGFNCCPKAINASVEIEGQIITVYETEIGPDCRCDCLYDLHIRIENLAADSYVIRMVEPYRHKDDEQLLVPIDLRSAETGSYCVPRFNYPWGQ